MASIFEFTNYRDYLNNWITSQPNGGRGIKGRLAIHLKVSSTLIRSYLINVSRG
jgi:hypothetical protein